MRMTNHVRGVMTRFIFLLMGFGMGIVLPVSDALAGGGSVVKVDVVGVEPWGFDQSDGSGHVVATGILPDIVAEFVRRSGVLVDLQVKPYARVVRDMMVGDCDVAFLAWSDDRRPYANIGTILATINFGVKARKGHPLATYSDLHSLTIGVVRGMAIEPEFDADKALRREESVDYTTAVKKAAAGRGGDAVAGSLASIDFIIEKYGLTDYFGDEILLTKRLVAVHFSRKSDNQQVAAIVNRTMDEIVADGTAAEIIHRWFESAHGPTHQAPEPWGNK